MDRQMVRENIEVAALRQYIGPPETQSIITVSPEVTVSTGCSPASKNPR